MTADNALEIAEIDCSGATLTAPGPIEPPQDLGDMAPVGALLATRYESMRQEGRSPVQAAALLLLAVQREKARRIDRGETLDVSWQASLAWLAYTVKHTPSAEGIMKACLLAMGGDIDLDDGTAACAAEIHRLDHQLRQSGQHRRDQLLIRLRPAAQLPWLQDNEHRVIVHLTPAPAPTSPHAAGKARVLPFRPIDLSPTRRLIQPLLNLGNAGRRLIRWPGKRQIISLFETLEQTVRDDELLSEVMFLSDEAHHGQALALARTIAATWNVPCYDLGDVDFVVAESAYLAAAERIKQTTANARRQ